MKITATITEEERVKTLENIMFDPCTHIKCGEVNCDACPLQGVSEALRRAQEDYARVINNITIEG